MTPDLLDLGRRAVKCKGWRWLPGMKMRCCDLAAPFLEQHSDRILELANGTIRIHGGFDECGCTSPHDWDLPDFSDPATLGCLLALVREAWGEPWARPQPIGHPDDFGWRVYGIAARIRHDAPTEAAALVAALEAAPEAR